MNITFIGHASILIETRGIRVLSDPWWRGPCFGAQWWNCPPPYLDPVQTKLDIYLYIARSSRPSASWHPIIPKLDIYLYIARSSRPSASWHPTIPKED